MTRPMNSLSASIISALALKPSTVYILRIENSETRQSWHIRRCFSEFCELREKILALIDDQMATYLTGLGVHNIESSAYTTGSNITSSATSNTGTCSSYRGKNRRPRSSPTSDSFCYIFKLFPPRKLFGSRSKRVIEARSLALNLFLQQTLEVVEVVRQRQLIAVCFSMMSHIESFLQCGAHRPVTRLTPSGSVDSMRPVRQGAVSPSAARRASAAMSLTPNFHHYPLVPTPAFTMTLADHRHHSKASRHHRSSSMAGGSEEETQPFNNFDFTQRFYREFGRQEERTAMCGNESDDEEEMQMPKKTRSAMLEGELRERKLHYSGSHFSMLENGQSSAETWTRRVEIAGIHSALRPKMESSSRQKNSRFASHGSEDHLHHHRANYRIPVQEYSNKTRKVKYTVIDGQASARQM